MTRQEWCIVQRSKEARALENVKRVFEKVWKQSSNAQSTKDNVKYALNRITDSKVADRLTPSEWNTVKSSVANHKKLNHNYQKAANGDTIIPIGNKLVYTDANYDSPGISKIIEFDSEYETEIDYAREEIYAVEKGKSTIEEAYDLIRLFTKIENINEYETENSTNAGKYDRRTSRGKSQSDTYHNNFLQERIRSANEIIHAVNNENAKASSKDGVFYSVSEQSLEDRLSGDALLDAQDLIAEIENVAEISPNGLNDPPRMVHRSTDTLYIVDAEILQTNKGNAVPNDKNGNISALPSEISITDLVNGVKIYDYNLHQNNVYSDADIKYSSSEDSEGRTLSKEQQEYFKDRKVRDDNGNLKEVYHGSPADFNTFSLEYLGTS